MSTFKVHLVTEPPPSWQSHLAAHKALRANMSVDDVHDMMTSHIPAVRTVVRHYGPYVPVALPPLNGPPCPFERALVPVGDSWEMKPFDGFKPLRVRAIDPTRPGNTVGTYGAYSVACQRHDAADASDRAQARKRLDKQLTAEFGLSDEEQLHRQVSSSLADTSWQSTHDGERQSPEVMRYSRRRHLAAQVDDQVAAGIWHAWDAWVLIHRMPWIDVPDAPEAHNAKRAAKRAAAVGTTRGRPIPTGAVSDTAAATAALAAVGTVLGTWQTSIGGTLARLDDKLFFTPPGGTTVERAATGTPLAVRRWLDAKRRAVVARVDPEREDRIAAVLEA